VFISFLVLALLIGATPIMIVFATPLVVGVIATLLAAGMTLVASALRPGESRDLIKLARPSRQLDRLRRRLPVSAENFPRHRIRDGWRILHSGGSWTDGAEVLHQAAPPIRVPLGFCGHRLTPQCDGQFTPGLAFALEASYIPFYRFLGSHAAGEARECESLVMRSP
jgi:hypothetical protein